MTQVDPNSVLMHRRESIAEVVLNRPARKNALTIELMTTLDEVLREVAVSDAQVLLLRGADGFFCSGLDTREVDPANSSIPAWFEVHRTLSTLQMPVVACLEGGAINAGAALVLACDLLVAGQNAYLQVMEASMGVTPPMNAAWLGLRYPASVGMQLALSCRPFSGLDLYRMGIALDVVADVETVQHARGLAQRIASYPHSAGRSTKRMLQRARGEVDGVAPVVAAAITSGERTEAGDGR